MKKIETKKFLPYVTLEQALAFRVGLPETSTGSRILDALLEAFETVPKKGIRDVVEFMGVREVHLNGAVQMILGMSLSDFRDQWLLARYVKVKAEHPEWQAGDVSRAMGFCDPSSVWKFLKRMGREDTTQRPPVCTSRTSR